MCQVFINLQYHLHFFLHFVFSFMGQLFLDDPISISLRYYLRNSCSNDVQREPDEPIVQALRRRWWRWLKAAMIAAHRCHLPAFDDTYDSLVEIRKHWLKERKPSLEMYMNPLFDANTKVKMISWYNTIIQLFKKTDLSPVREMVSQEFEKWNNKALMWYIDISLN